MDTQVGCRLQLVNMCIINAEILRAHSLGGTGLKLFDSTSINTFFLIKALNSETLQKAVNLNVSL